MVKRGDRPCDRECVEVPSEKVKKVQKRVSGRRVTSESIDGKVMG